MGRRIETGQRKQVFSISMEARQAEALTKMGSGSITAGFAWLFEKHAREHPEGEAGLVMQAQAHHAAKAAEKASAITAVERDRELRQEAKAAARMAALKIQDMERAARKAKKESTPSKAVLAFRETVKHFIDMNADRVANGRSLFSLNHLRATQADMVDAVEADALALYGCKSGTPARRMSIDEAGAIAAERGYSQQWVNAVTGSEPGHDAPSPAPAAESLTLTPHESAPEPDEPHPSEDEAAAPEPQMPPAEAQHEEPVF
jgi:hypothetical protein